MKSQLRRAVSAFVLFQLGLTLTLAGLMLVAFGVRGAQSSLLAGCIQVIATLLFAFFCFRHHGAKRARLIVRSFYQGEALKIVLMIMMLVVVFNAISVYAAPFFLTFIAVQFSNWLLPQFFSKV